MNWIESVVYKVVRGNPTIKNFVRNTYQSFFDLLPRKKEYIRYSMDFREGYYFGFHDLQEMSADGTKLLVQQLSFDLRMPARDEKEKVGWMDLDSDGKLGQFHMLAETAAWNYHKGCRLQWLDDDRVIFNTAMDGKTVSEIIRLENGDVQYFGYPMDTVSHDALCATSFSYERLEHCMHGYGYPYSDDSFMDTDAPAETGLFLINLKDGTRELAVPLSMLANGSPEEFREGYMHYVTHSEFSADDRYVSFLHRWRRRTGTDLKRWTRIMVYDRFSGNLIELPTQISGSHYVWNSRNQLIASCVIDGKSCHVLFDMKDPGAYKVISPDVLNSDGHQSFVGDDIFITDTYPDKFRMAKLYRVNIIDGKTELLASLYSPARFQSSTRKGHIACDLHPRVSRDGRYVLFDSCRTGKRGIYVMKLS